MLNGETFGSTEPSDGEFPLTLPVTESTDETKPLQRSSAETYRRRLDKDLPYIKLYTKNTVEQFIKRYLIGSLKAQSLVIISPFLGRLERDSYQLKDILKRAEKDHTRVYIVTRAPEAEYQIQAIELLKQYSCVEIRYNPEIHAKLYICWGREVEESYAFFGSGNLTSGGLRYNLELGMMILARGDGKSIVSSLYEWGSFEIRIASTLIKQIS